MRYPTTPVRSKDEFIVFGAPDIGEEEIAAVEECLRSGWLGTGPRVATFERAFADYVGSRFAVAVNSCTAALHLSLLALELHPGDEVITTPLTFCATVNAIIHAGGTPVFADVDRETMNISPSEIERRITKKTRAILPVHFAGLPCRMDEIMSLARQHNLAVVEDCAHSIEAEFKGQKTGTFGAFGCFSFYVTKNVVTGEGGMVVTNDEGLSGRIKVLALHGMDRDAWKRFSDTGYRHYQVVEAGFKYNMMDIQAAIGIPQLQRVEANHSRRRQIWRTYTSNLDDLPITLPRLPTEDSTHALHLFTIQINEKRAGVTRDEFLAWMTANNIGVGVHYVALTRQPLYQRLLKVSPSDFPAATEIGDRTVSLPLSSKLTDRDVADVCSAVRAAFGTHG